MTKSFSFARTATLALIVSGIVATATPAMADSYADPDKTPTAAIDISKVDFTSARAVAHLSAQVRHVALELCMGNAHYQAGMDLDEKKCYNNAVAISLAQIDVRRQQALRATGVQIATAQGQTAAGR